MGCCRQAWAAQSLCFKAGVSSPPSLVAQVGQDGCNRRPGPQTSLSLWRVRSGSALILDDRDSGRTRIASCNAWADRFFTGYQTGLFSVDSATLLLSRTLLNAATTPPALYLPAALFYRTAHRTRRAAPVHHLRICRAPLPPTCAPPVRTRSRILHAHILRARAARYAACALHRTACTTFAAYSLPTFCLPLLCTCHCYAAHTQPAVAPYTPTPRVSSFSCCHGSLCCLCRWSRLRATRYRVAG